MKNLLFGTGPSKIQALPPGGTARASSLPGVKKSRDPSLHIAPISIGSGMAMSEALQDYPGRGIPGVVKEDAKENVSAGAVDV